jgi:hypothetical protein
MGNTYTKRQKLDRRFNIEIFNSINEEMSTNKLTRTIVQNILLRNKYFYFCSFLTILIKAITDSNYEIINYIINIDYNNYNIDYDLLLNLLLQHSFKIGDIGIINYLFSKGSKFIDKEWEFYYIFENKNNDLITQIIIKCFKDNTITIDYELAISRSNDLEIIKFLFDFQRKKTNNTKYDIKLVALSVYNILEKQEETNDNNNKKIKIDNLFKMLNLNDDEKKVVKKQLLRMAYRNINILYILNENEKE